MHIKDCYLFSENWPLCQYVMLFFIPDNFPCLKSALSEINITFIFFWLVLDGIIFLPLYF